MTNDGLKSLLDSMSLEEKVGQLVQCNAGQFISNSLGITGPDGKKLPAEDLNRVMGSVLTFENAQQAKALQDKHLMADPKKIPLLLMLDVIHGLRTTYPIPLAMGCSFDNELIEECADMARKEAAACGVHVTFNPMVDTARDARWGRILETNSEEPLINARMGAALVRVTQGSDLSSPENIACCVKHFAAYGAGEAGRDYNTVELSERVLRESYLPAYKACVDAGARLVMPSFNALNGIPSVANKWLMNQVLREEWGFRGVVISDYDAVGELVNHGIAKDLRDAVRLAMEAGCDIDMVRNAYYLHLADLVRNGVVAETAVDEAVMRVLRLKNELGLFENPYHGADEDMEKKLYLCPAHREIARRAAEESAVLLKNNGILPLSGLLKQVALIGPFAEETHLNGFWSRLGVDRSLWYALEHSVSIEQSGLLGGIPAEDLNAVALFKCILNERKAPTGVFPAAEFIYSPADHVSCEFVQPFCSGYHGYMRFLVDFIRILAGKTHPDGFRRSERRLICVFAVGVQGWIIRITKRPVVSGPGSLFGIAFPLAVAADMKADFGEHFSVDVLQRQPAVADHLAGILQADGPETETVLPVSVHVSFDPVPDVLPVESIRIMPHRFSVAEHQRQRLKIIGLHFPELQPLCFHNHASSSLSHRQAITNARWGGHVAVLEKHLGRLVRIHVIIDQKARP